MPSLRKYSGTKLLEAVAAGQQGYAFGDDMATSKANRDIAREDSERRANQDRRAEELQPLTLAGMEASVTGKKGANAINAQKLGESQRSEQTRLDQLEASLAQTESATKINQDQNQRQEDLQRARVRSGNAAASSAEAQASINKRIDARAQKTEKADDQAAILKAQGAVQSVLTANARGYAESVNLPLTLQTEELNARVENQLATEKFAIEMATSKSETQEDIAQLNAQALEGANRTMAGLAKHRPAEALTYAYDSPNFGIKRAAGNKVVINNGKVEIQDKDGDILHDSVRDRPAVFDFTDLFQAVDMEVEKKKANIEYIQAQTARQLGAGGKSGMSDSEERARLDDITQVLDELGPPDGVENVEQYNVDVMDAIARDASKFSKPPALVADSARKRVETTYAKKTIESMLSESGLKAQVSGVEILTFVEDPENGVSSPTEAIPLIVERYLKAMGE